MVVMMADRGLGLHPAASGMPDASGKSGAVGGRYASTADEQRDLNCDNHSKKCFFPDACLGEKYFLFLFFFQPMSRLFCQHSVCLQ